MTVRLEGPPLAGSLVRLEPLGHAHAADLAAAVGGDRSTFGFTTVPAADERSRAAIAATGAVFEGVLRRWSRSRAAGEEGRLRDSAMFSVVAEEWPACRDRLRAGVARHLPG